MKQHIKRLIPLLALVIAIVAAFYFRLDHYLSFAALAQHQSELTAWVNAHYLLSVLSFMAIYIGAVSLSLPGALFLTLVGGFLFGNILGTLYVVVSATIGATLIFMIVQYSLGNWLAQKAHQWVFKMQAGFQKNALSYMLFLRLIPLFPFWVVNIVPAVLNIPTSIFMIATFFGIIPGSFVYVTLGNGLSHLLAEGQAPDLGLIFSPQVLLPILGLALLSLAPIVYKKLTKPHDTSHHSQ